MRFYNLNIPEKDYARVTALFLPGKNLEVIPEVVFKMPNLIHLNLNENHISNLPEGFKRCISLRNLELVANNFNSAGDLKNTPPNLTNLDLSNNDFFEFPEPVTKLKRLKILILSNNSIKKIPPSIQKLNLLQELVLDGNRIKTIPVAIGKLKSLRTFSINNNLLTSIPKAIGNCFKLSRLSANNNHIKIIDKALGNCTELNYLHLNTNKLNNLPDRLNGCIIMQFLDLTNNEFRNIPTCIFSYKWLSKLYMGGNNLVETDLKNISSRLFLIEFDKNKIYDIQNLPKSLEDISMNHNRLKHFPKAVLVCEKLKKLSLEQNKIEDLPEDFGALKKQLKVLKLKYNPVKSRPEHLLQLRQLEGLSGVMSKKQRLAILTVIKDMRQNNIPTSLALDFLKIAMGENPNEKNLSIDNLIKFLNTDNPVIGQNIRTRLYKKTGVPLYKNRLKKGHCLSLLGSTHFDLSPLRQRLEKLGISFVQGFCKQTTHVLLGWGKFDSRHIPSSALTLLSEKMLSKELGRLEKVHLLREKDEKILNSVRSLLLSNELVNQQLGIALLKGGGLPQSLLSAIFANWIKTEDRQLSQSIFQLLILNTADEWKFVLKKYKKQLFKQNLLPKKEIKRSQLSSNPVFEKEIKKFYQKNKLDLIEIKKALSVK